MMLAINFIMITSASSTLDSTFASFSKLVTVDWKIGNLTVTNGRIVMIIVALIGTIPVFFGPEILSATTISGTMVIGLAPIFLLWQTNVPKITFNLTVLTGVFFGLWFALGGFPASLVLFNGSYGALLSVNIFGTIACFSVFFGCKFLIKSH